MVIGRRLIGTLALAFSSVVLIVGCGGGGISTPRAIATATGQPVLTSYKGATAIATFAIRIPPATSAAANRGRQYVSPSTASLVISIANASHMSEEKLTETVASPQCIPASDGSTTCTYSLTVPVGTSQSFEVQALDAAQNLLSDGETDNASIVLDAANVVAVHLLGDVANVVLAVATAVPACTATTAPLTILAEDADKNVITGTYSQPITLAAAIPSSFPSPAASATPNSSVSPATYAMATGTPTPLVSYDGKSPGGATITATVGGKVVGSLLFTPKPTICSEYPVPLEQVQGTTTSGVGPRGIVTAPNGYLYEANYTQGTLGQVVSTLGTGGLPVGTITPVTLTDATVDAVTDLQIYPRPDEIAVDPSDSTLFVTDEINGIDTVAYSANGAATGAQNSYTQDGSNGQGSEYPDDIVLGPTAAGPLFYTNGIANQIVAVTTAGTFTIFPLTSPPAGPTPIPGSVASPNPNATVTPVPSAAPNPGPKGMTLGSDGRLYFAEMRDSKIGVVSPSAVMAGGAGTTQTEYPVTTGSQPDQLTMGPGGLLWFTELSGSIGSMSTSGANLHEYSVGGHAAPNHIVYAADGNLYFTDTGNNAIGRVTPSGTISEYPVPTLSSGLYGITLGPDGNAWFTESTGGNVGYLGY